LLALEAESVQTALALVKQPSSLTGSEVLVVCRESATGDAGVQQISGLIPVPDNTSVEEARRIGVNNAHGDVVRVTTAKAPRRWLSASWTDRMTGAGVRRSARRDPP